MKPFLFFILLLTLTTVSVFGQATQKAGEGVWANYDFVPGNQVLAYHDFQNVYVGNFPDRIQYLAGDMEVVQLADGNNVLRTNNEGRFVVSTGASLPEKFTVEFRVQATDKRSKVMMYSPTEKAPIKSPGSTLAALLDHQGTGLSVGKYEEGPKSLQKLAIETYMKKWVDVRIAVDKTYWKMYVNEKRVANLPQVSFPTSAGLAFYFSVYPYDGGEVYIDDICIAEGGRSMLYDELKAKGFVVTHGILFDVNSASLRPESTPTLLDMARMLKDNRDVKVRIEGHTDNTGRDEINAPLSEKRAQRVMQWLIQNHGIDPSRLKAEGFGATRPMASNETDEGRQSNRRVELHLF